MPKASKSSKLNRIARRVASGAAPIPVSAATEIKKTKEDDNDAEQEPEEPGINSSQTLSRGQRKRLAKREQYLRREKLVLTTLKLGRQEEQKKRIDGLDAIKEALMNTTKETKRVDDSNNNDSNNTKSYNTNKSKKTMVASELEHQSLVMQHPSFIANPFETMQEHLRNTLAANREQMEHQSKLRIRKEKEEAEEKARLKKELGMKKKSKKKFKVRSRS